MKTTVLKAVILFGNLFLVKSVTWTEVRDALAASLGELTTVRSIRPSINLSDVLAVSLDMNIASINDFDDSNGFMDISGYLSVNWTAAAYLDADSITALAITDLLQNNNIWKPPILFVNALRQADEIGSDSNNKIRFDFTTFACTWQPWFILRGACSPDVTYYPYDQQECSFKFAAWGYTSTEMVFQLQNSEISFNFFEENGAWEVESTSASTSIVNGVSVATYKIKVTRRPLYYVINLLSPIILLGILNVFVFLLPIDSGERIGFAITCLLAYVVLLNTVMNYLPVSSLSISLLSYYTFIMMLFSGGMSLAAIFTVRIHYKAADTDSKVPRILQSFIKLMTCRLCSRNSNKIDISNRRQTILEDLENTPANVTFRKKRILEKLKEVKIENIEKIDRKDEKDEIDEKEIQWRHVSSVLDLVFFFGFLGTQIFYSLAYLVPIFTRA